MRHKHVIIGVLAAMALTSAPHAAFAQPPEPPAQLRLGPTGLFGLTPGAGIGVVALHCLGGPEGPATSPGFTDGIHLSLEGGNEYRGVGTLTSKAGTYTATLRCKGNPAPAEATFTIQERPQDVGFMLRPSEVAPGGTVNVNTPAPSPCVLEVTSPGFVAPIAFTLRTNTTWSGSGKVITTPGTYQATIRCYSHPYVFTFTILGDPPITPNPKPQVPVKPKGAPETGDGSTA